MLSRQLHLEERPAFGHHVGIGTKADSQDELTQATTQLKSGVLTNLPLVSHHFEPIELESSLTQVKNLTRVTEIGRLKGPRKS